jgi:tetratricopeptide (TPR) repeat protein
MAQSTVKPDRTQAAYGLAGWAVPGWLRWLGLLGLCVLAYYPAIHGGFLWDDNAHVTAPELQPVAGLARIWFELGATQQYYPVLHSAFWIEHRLWGDAAVGYHWLNILLHAAAAGLLVRLLRRLAIPGAWLAGCVFALHPVGVESVAWITEQKNTLSAVFYLLAACAYLRFEEERGSGRATAGAWRCYAVASALFVLAILTKSVTATLPAALLVVAWWRRGRISWRGEVAPLLPWFAVGIVAGLFTAWVERKLIGAEGAAYDLDFLQRCVLAGRAVWFYVGKLLWPADLMFVYPRWTVNATSVGQIFGLLALLAALGALWLLRGRTRGPLAGALFFGGTLFPALGFFNVFPFVYSYVADHFQYLACLGVIVPASAGLAIALARVPALPRWAGPAICSAVVGGLGWLTWHQAHIYRDNVTLYRATLEKNPACWMAAYNLGMELAAKGQTDAAIACYRNALRLRPNYAEAQANLAMALLAQPDGRDEAVALLESALKLKADFWQAHCNLANILLAVPGRQEEAIAHYKEVLRIKPDLAEIRFNLALVLLNLPDRQAEAIPHLEGVLKLNPNLWQAHYALGNLLLAVPGRQEEGVRHLQESLRLKPDLAQARQVLEQVRR